LKLGCNGKKIKCFLSKSTSLPEAWNIQGGGISLQFSYNKYKGVILNLHIPDKTEIVLKVAINAITWTLT
jgi:hypothetical protein